MDDEKCVMLVLLDFQQRSVQWITEFYCRVSPVVLVCEVLPTLGLSLTCPVAHSSSKSEIPGVGVGPNPTLDLYLPLGAILRRHGVGFHMYVHDTQLYLSTKTTKVENAMSACTVVEVSLRELSK